MFVHYLYNRKCNLQFRVASSDKFARNPFSSVKRHDFTEAFSGRSKKGDSIGAKQFAGRGPDRPLRGFSGLTLVIEPNSLPHRGPQCARLIFHRNFLYGGGHLVGILNQSPDPALESRRNPPNCARPPADPFYVHSKLHRKPRNASSRSSDQWLGWADKKYPRDG